MSWMVEAFQEGIMAILFVSGPVILVTSVIGLSVGLIQTVTSVQDQTTPSALKIVGVAIVFIVGGVWMYGYLTEFTEKTWANSFEQVSRNHRALLLNDENADGELSIAESASNQEKADSSIDGDESLLQTFTTPMNIKESLPSPENQSRTINPPLETFRGPLASASPPSTNKKPPYKPQANSSKLPPKNTVRLKPQNPRKIPKPVLPSGLGVLEDTTGFGNRDNRSFESLQPPLTGDGERADSGWMGDQ